MGAVESKKKHIKEPSSIFELGSEIEKKEETNGWLEIPNELLLLIVEFLEDSQSFYNLALTSKQLSSICQDPCVQYDAKLKFSKKHTSLMNLILQPGGERVFIRHHRTLPCGSKYGEETIWNHAVKLQLLLRDGGLCLQGVVDVKDKILSNKKWWENDRIVGREEGFYPDGKAEFIRFWDENGNLDGEEEIWYENGNLKVKSYRQNGVLEGVQQGWYPDGTPHFVRLWRKGALEGPEKEWNESGELITHVIWPVNNKGKKKDCLEKQTKTKKHVFFRRR